MAYLNIFSIHYFLWFSALTPIYGYVSVYAEHYANASSSQYGLLNMVLPFASIIAKLFFCSLADRRRAHRSFFIWFLSTSLIGFGSFGILPFFIQPQPKESGLNIGIWILICLMTTVSTISMAVISCLSDAFAMNSSKKNDTSYGYIRLWGTLGWGMSSLLLAFVNQTDKLPLLVPGLLMTIALLVTDCFVASLWPRRDDFTLDQSSEARSEQSSKEVTHYGSTELNNRLQDTQEIDEILDSSSVKIQWILFKEVARRRRSLFRYMFLFTISGALISMQWSYFFLYLKNIYAADFTYITGLSMVGQSMIGELPFFILSKFFINWMGRSHTLSLSFLAIGLRYLMYGLLLPNSNMYFVLLTESLQGPSFGLFYVVMTEVGLDYSNCEGAVSKVLEQRTSSGPEDVDKMRQALRATMQSLMSACYEGLGLGLGSIIGGVVIEYGSFYQLWLWSAVVATGIGIINILVEVCSFTALVDQYDR